jgi:hypothetical protein
MDSFQPDPRPVDFDFDGRYRQVEGRCDLRVTHAILGAHQQGCAVNLWQGL